MAKLAAAPGSPASGQMYYDTGTNTLFWYNGTAWVSAGTGANDMGVVVHGSTAGTARPGGYGVVFWIGTVEPTNATANDPWLNPLDSTSTNWGIVEALPGGAVVGDFCTFKAAATIFWELAYTGEATYPWAKVGGPPLNARSDTARALASQTTYASLPTDPLSITLPLAGDYDIRVEADVDTKAAGQAGFLSYAMGATAASDAWAGEDIVGSNIAPGIKQTRQTARAKNDAVVEKARTGGAYTIEWKSRRLWVDPVRVG